MGQCCFSADRKADDDLNLARRGYIEDPKVRAASVDLVLQKNTPRKGDATPKESEFSKQQTRVSK